MKVSNVLVIVFALICSAQDPLTIDTTAQRLRPPQARGPFPGSTSPGHSAGLPIRLELRIPTQELLPNGSTVVDFIITNIGTEPIKLPSSIVLFNSPRARLSLWVTPDAVKDQYLTDPKTGRVSKMFPIEGIAAELDASDDPNSFYVLPPNKSIQVHAPSGFQLVSGAHSFTAHAEFFGASPWISEGRETADSETVTASFSATSPTPDK
jgi:hypothetical protein